MLFKIKTSNITLLTNCLIPLIFSTIFTIIGFVITRTIVVLFKV